LSVTNDNNLQMML